MEECTTIASIRETVRAWRGEGFTVGLVPTMGYLHAGHRSLIERAAAENDRAVVSVFVNPMQFGPGEDLAVYPHDRVRDSRVCAEAGAALVFRPEPEEMYPAGFCSFVDMTGLTGALCGASRPGHFRGVCTVVAKLFGIVRPDRAYFGRKDAQQLAVIQRMSADLDMGVEIVGCPIVREPDGLAMSSRNAYLSAEERRAALCLSRALREGRERIAEGERSAAVLLSAMRAVVEAEPLARPDYIEIVDPATMRPVPVLDRTVLCAMAVYIGRTRLIDNFMTGENGSWNCAC